MTRALLAFLFYCLAASAAVAEGSPFPPISEADLNPNPNITIQNELPKLQLKKRSARAEAFFNLSQKLSMAYNRKIFPSLENKELLSKSLISIYNEDPETSPVPRREIVEALTKYGENKYAKPLILRILDGSVPEERNSALRMLGAPGGVSGAEFFDRTNELAKRGLIKGEERTTYLARVDKAAAKSEIINELQKTTDRNSFYYSSRALQDYYREPENYRYIVPRLKEFGLASDGRVVNAAFRGSSGIGWIDRDLFVRYIESAPSTESKQALDILVHEATLCGPPAVELLYAKLKDADSEVRAMAAFGLTKSAEFHNEVDGELLKRNLREALDSERSEPAKKEIAHALAHIEKLQSYFQRAQERPK